MPASERLIFSDFLLDLQGKRLWRGAEALGPEHHPTRALLNRPGKEASFSWAEEIVTDQVEIRLH